jgi:hypothetical protein
MLRPILKTNLLKDGCSKQYRIRFESKAPLTVLVRPAHKSIHRLKRGSPVTLGSQGHSIVKIPDGFKE